jgi:TolB protein
MKSPRLLVLLFILTIPVLFSFMFYTTRKAPDLRIVYNTILNDTCTTYEIFTMNLDGSDKKNVSNWAGADWAYATFDDRIYFVSDRDTTARMWFLYEMDVNGKNVRRISPMRLQDSYVGINSTGRQIMVTPYLKDRKWFFVLDIKTGIVLDTLKVPLANIAHPLYLPGDEQVVFCGAREKKKAEELFVMNLDGTGLRQLTQYPKNDTTARWYETHASNPVWNSSQKRVTYFSKQKGNHSIYAINLDGTGQKQITDDSFNEGWHAWSPDGKLMVYDGSDLADKNFDIYIMHADGTNVKRLTQDPAVEQAPLFIRNKK